MDIVITKDSRGMGLGGALLEEAKKWASQRQLDYLELDVLSNNDRAIEFYSGHGFEGKRQVMYCRV